MLVLMCRDDVGRYAIETKAVVEVVPCVDVVQLDRPADIRRGILNYRGRSTPVIDLTRLRSGQEFVRRWNTRIVMVEPPDGRPDERIGLIGERVTASEMDDRIASTAASSTQGCLGPILLDDQGMFELVDLSRLLSELSAKNLARESST